MASEELTEANSKFFGLVSMAKLQAAAMERARMPREGRRDFYIYVDEFQSVATQNFPWKCRNTCMFPTGAAGCRAEGTRVLPGLQSLRRVKSP